MSTAQPITLSGAEGDAPASELEEAVMAAIELIRPALNADGGDIILRGIEDDVVTVELTGACNGCPLSTDTMRGGVERIIKDKVPGVREVIAV